jgi:hypothetical protein
VELLKEMLGHRTFKPAPHSALVNQQEWLAALVMFLPKPIGEDDLRKNASLLTKILSRITKYWR